MLKILGAILKNLAAPATWICEALLLKLLLHYPYTCESWNWALHTISLLPLSTFGRVHSRNLSVAVFRLKFHYLKVTARHVTWNTPILPKGQIFLKTLYKVEPNYIRVVTPEPSIGMWQWNQQYRNTSICNATVSKDNNITHHSI
jgi:hypothetical protein